jgi:multisubunit Na+/H+ antiporter MnhE subunit
MTTVLILALPFSLVFMAFSGQLSWQGFVVGYPLSIAALWLGQAYNLNFKPQRVFSQVIALIVYSTRLAVDIFLSSIQVARIVLSPNLDEQLNTAVKVIGSQDDTNNEIITAMSSHGITITPGQMVIDIEEQDGKTLLHVHNLNAEFAGELETEQTGRLHLIRKVLGYE